MNFDAGSLFASFMIGTVGFGIFQYGRKQQRPPHFAVGLVLMIYPYFVPGVIPMIGIALALVGLLWLTVHKGWL